MTDEDRRNFQTDYTPDGTTLAQDAAEASLQLAEGMLEAASTILDDDSRSSELPATDAWRAAYLEVGAAIAYALIDGAAAIREADHG